MKLKYIILFFGLSFILDFTCGEILSDKIINIDFGDFGIINKGIKSNSEILILGSSRARHHYDSNIFTQELNLTTYNAGVGGYGLFLNYAMLDENLKINAPKIVILDLAPNVIIDKDSYAKLNSLLPYYKKYSSFKEIIQLNSEFSKFETISNLYIYNSTLYDVVRNELYKDNNKNFGYIPLDGKMSNDNFEPYYHTNEKTDSNKIEYLYKIMKLCEDYDVKLIVVVSPTYTKFDRNNKIIKIFQTILNENNIDFYDYSNFNKLYLNTNYFTDQLHMNKFGTEIFSINLAKNINKALNN